MIDMEILDEYLETYLFLSSKAQGYVQGVVIHALGNGFYIVDTFSGLTGDYYCSQIHHITEMKDWKFFRHTDRETYERVVAQILESNA